MPAVPKITKRLVDSVRPDPAKQIFRWDSELRGFGICVKPSGAGAFIIQYRNADGRSRRMVIGKIGTLTPDEARSLARKHLASIAEGRDPLLQRHSARSAINVGGLCDLYVEEAERRRKALIKEGKTARKGVIKASTLAMDRSRIERHVKPLIGRISIRSLTSNDLKKLQKDIAAGKSAKKRSGGRGGQTRGGSAVAARTLGMLGTILEYARKENLIDVNPARGIPREPDQKRRRFLSPEEIAALGTAMTESEERGDNPVACAAIRFLLLTGFRRMEALALKWADVDAKRRCIHLQDSKSGPQTRAIGSAAIRVLDAQPRIEGVPWVFPAAVGSGHAVGVPKVLGRICATANIEDVTLHTLRHSFASVAAELGYSELTIAGLLGHQVPGITARYSHLPDSALLGAADAVASLVVQRLMSGEATSAAIIPIGARNK
jgi:integrase